MRFSSKSPKKKQSFGRLILGGILVAALIVALKMIKPPSPPPSETPPEASSATEDSVQTQEAPANHIEVYQTVPPNKSLLTSPQFIVIDDFNSGRFKSVQGAAWRTKVPAEGALDLSLDKRDGRNPQRGYSLKAAFNLLAGEKAYLQRFLDNVDVSRAEHFVFKYLLKPKGTAPFKSHLSVTLTDWRHKHATYVIEKLELVPDDGWREIILPMKRFEGLDLDQLFSLKITLYAGDERTRGDLWLDEIAFFGFNDVAFESHRDNFVGYPKTVYATLRRKELITINDNRRLLREIARDTWDYFQNARDKDTFLIADHVGMGAVPLAADYTTPTNMAMDLMTSVAAMDLGFISKEEAEERAGKVLATMREMRRYKGFFYNFYNTKKLNVNRSYISTVDSGWLAIALVVVRQAFPGPLAESASRFLDVFDFEEFLDPENNHLVIGLDVPERNFGTYHYGMLISEARATSLYAIGKGDIPRDHWWFLYRTPPAAWKWQKQKPQGKYVVYEGLDVFEGYYLYGNKKFVPSWGGSLFEFLMPTIVLKERELGTEGLGLNNRTATEIHRDHALREKRYPVWGISPAAVVDGRRWKYVENGIPQLAVKGYPDLKIITPHVSFLALDTLPEDALTNIRRLLHYEMYGEYGFYDSINLRNHAVNPQYLALDQGMTLLAICNYLEDGSIRERFHADPVGKNAEDLIQKESFF